MKRRYRTSDYRASDYLRVDQHAASPYVTAEVNMLRVVGGRDSASERADAYQELLDSVMHFTADELRWVARLARTIERGDQPVRRTR